MHRIINQSARLDTRTSRPLMPSRRLVCIRHVWYQLKYLHLYILLALIDIGAYKVAVAAGINRMGVLQLQRIDATCADQAQYTLAGAAPSHVRPSIIDLINRHDGDTGCIVWTRKSTTLPPLCPIQYGVRNKDRASICQLRSKSGRFALMIPRAFVSKRNEISFLLP